MDAPMKARLVRALSFAAGMPPQTFTTLFTNRYNSADPSPARYVLRKGGEGRDPPQPCPVRGSVGNPGFRVAAHLRKIAIFFAVPMAKCEPFARSGATSV